jgi:hypothetical protein
LTGSSMVAIEAMLMDVPVISMDFCNEIHGVKFIDAGATLHVTSYEDLEERVKMLLGIDRNIDDLNEKVHEFLSDAFMALDGQSARRTAEALWELARRTSPNGRPEQVPSKHN